MCFKDYLHTFTEFSRVLIIRLKNILSRFVVIEIIHEGNYGRKCHLRSFQHCESMLMAKIGSLLASDALYLDQYSKHDFYLFARRPVLDADDLLGRIEHISD